MIVTVRSGKLPRNWRKVGAQLKQSNFVWASEATTKSNCIMMGLCVINADTRVFNEALRVY